MQKKQSADCYIKKLRTTLVWSELVWREEGSGHLPVLDCVRNIPQGSTNTEKCSTCRKSPIEALCRQADTGCGRKTSNSEHDYIHCEHSFFQIVGAWQRMIVLCTHIHRVKSGADESSGGVFRKAVLDESVYQTREHFAA